MAVRRLALAAAVAALLAGAGTAHAAGFNLQDTLSTGQLTFDFNAADNDDQVNVFNNVTSTGFVGNTGALTWTDALPLTFQYSGFGVDTAPSVDYFFEDANGNVVSQLVYGYDGTYATGTYTNYVAEGQPVPTIPNGAVLVPANQYADASFYGMDGGTETIDTPEPASLALLGAGLAGLGLTRRRRR
jgi:hypothetical protein